ncbi:GAP family protein [Rhodococcus sp. IEGM 1379]|uniref:GAP family protein n=1 Tax=Rhodococcus sp. IEGM 1379 TaxID=3047086 RepID=UPI0024B86AE1|nr:GAP family protein [Rhodococcus sp. IEGM 1379]MDI9913654.1 GAP family protein [Rhodococcus sp. IEGM 1379]
MIGGTAHHRDELAAAVHAGSDRGEDLKSFGEHRQHFLTARRWIAAAFVVVALLSKEALTCHRLRMAGEKQPGVGSERSTHVPGTVTLFIRASPQSIGSASLATGEVIVSILVFTIIAGCTVAIPVAEYLVAADRLREPLAQLKVWLQEYNTTVMSVLILVIGGVLIGKGICGIR